MHTSLVFYKSYTNQKIWLYGQSEPHEVNTVRIYASTFDPSVELLDELVATAMKDFPGVERREIKIIAVPNTPVTIQFNLLALHSIPASYVRYQV